MESITADSFQAVFSSRACAGVTHGNGISENVEDIPRAIENLLHRVARCACVRCDFTGTRDDVETACAGAYAAIQQRAARVNSVLMGIDNHRALGTTLCVRIVSKITWCTLACRTTLNGSVSTCSACTHGRNTEHAVAHLASVSCALAPSNQKCTAHAFAHSSVKIGCARVRSIFMRVGDISAF